MIKVLITVVISPATLILCGLLNGYKIERMVTKDLPGFTEGNFYLVRAGNKPGYGYKFYVRDDNQDHKILSPWHFGYNFQ